MKKINLKKETLMCLLALLVGIGFVYMILQNYGKFNVKAYNEPFVVDELNAAFGNIVNTGDDMVDGAVDVASNLVNGDVVTENVNSGVMDDGGPSGPGPGPGPSGGGPGPGPGPSGGDPSGGGPSRRSRTDLPPPPPPDATNSATATDEDEETFISGFSGFGEGFASNCGAW